MNALKLIVPGVLVVKLKNCFLIALLLILLFCDAQGNKPLKTIDKDDSPEAFDLSAVYGYKSSQKFDPRGMDQVYYITGIFLHLVLPKRYYPNIQDLFNVTDDLKVEVSHDVNDYIQFAFHYRVISLMAICGIALSLLMPFIGFIFCCCRCAGKCGGKEEVYEKKGDSCRRIALSSVLCCLIITTLFGIVSAFVMNQFIEEGLGTLPNNLKTSLDDTQMYLQNTKKDVDHLFIQDFRSLEERLFYSLDSAGSILKERLADVSEAIVIKKLAEIVSGMERIVNNLKSVINYTNQLQTDSSFLKARLSESQARLSKIFHDYCQNDLCSELVKRYEELQGLKIKTDFYSLPDVREVTRKIESLLQNNIEEDVLAGKAALDSIDVQVQFAVNDNIPIIKSELMSAGMKLAETSRSISNKIEIPNFYETHQFLDKLKVYINIYAFYRWYFCLGMCVLLLIIVTCFIFGLFYGFCARRASSPYSSEQCVKRTGSTWFMMAVGLMFLSSISLLLPTAIFFVVGSVGEHMVCQELDDIQPDSMVINKLDKLLLGESKILPIPVDKNFTLASVLRDCHSNRSLYEIFDLESNFKQLSKMIEVYKSKLDVKSHVDRLKDNVKINTNITILSKRAKSKLQSLGSSGLSDINFEIYSSTLKQQLLGLDLLTLAKDLNETAITLGDINSNVASQLINESLYLVKLHATLTSVLTTIIQLQNTTDVLLKEMKFNQTTFHEGIDVLIKTAEYAQSYLHKRGKNEIEKLASEFADDFYKMIQDYISHLDDHIHHELGRCWPISQAYNASVIAVCNNVIDPFNAYWASVGWCMTLFLPSMVLAIILASLYKNINSYFGAVREREYVYEMYEGRENIPLSSGAKKAYLRSGVTCERADYPDDAYLSHPVLPQYSAPSYSQGIRQTRWDFPPSDGPPQYSQEPPSSEYDRPPPYYYPGPS